jgi:hypothetical protein
MNRWWGGSITGAQIANWNGISCDKGLSVSQDDAVISQYFQWQWHWYGEMKSVSNSGTSNTADDIKGDIAANLPVLVAQNHNGTGSSADHDRLAIAYTSTSIYVHDPAGWLGNPFFDLAVSNSQFESLWNVTWWGIWPIEKKHGGAVGYPGNFTLPTISTSIDGVPSSIPQASSFQIKLTLNVNSNKAEAYTYGVHVRVENAEFSAASKGTFEKYQAYDQNGNPVSIGGSKIVEFTIDSYNPANNPYGYLTINATSTPNITFRYRSWVTDANDKVHCGIHTSSIGDDRGWNGGHSPVSMPRVEPWIIRDPASVADDGTNFLPYPTSASVLTVTATNYTISGHVRTESGNPIGGVIMSGLPGNPSTDANGYYFASVNYRWSGTVTPTKTGYDFNSATTVYASVTSNLVTDYIGRLQIFTILAGAGANGSIGPVGSVQVDYGSSQVFSISPNTGYHISDVIVDGSSVGTNSTYRFNNITSNHTIAASFAINSFSIVASADANGSIQPGGTTQADYGSSKTFGILPNEGYRILDVNVDGSSVGATASYVFKNIASNHSISAAFDKILAVELASFESRAEEDKVLLQWTTATETDNSGFEVQRSVKDGHDTAWVIVGFLKGFGSTNSPHKYSCLDLGLQPNRYLYRLKQINYDGSFVYNQTVTVEVIAPTNYVLEQNFPNPFNPSTSIRFDTPFQGKVRLQIFNILGELVEDLVHKDIGPGYYTQRWDAKGRASGIYFYRIQAESSDNPKKSFTQVRKMVLLK